MKHPTHKARPQRTRRPFTSRTSAVIAVLLAASLLLAGCTTTPATTPRLEWGVFVPDDGAPSSDINVVTDMAGEQPRYVLRFAAIDQPVPLDRLAAISDAGQTPILTLEPWVPGGGVDQPGYSLARIAAGAHDAALDRWAKELATWDRPLLLRFAHEMTGSWYPWSIGANGNTAQDFIAAWEHVHALFQTAGADQVAFIWAPNVPCPGSTDYQHAYPPPDTVDYLGVDGYNWGNRDGRTWQEPSQLFGEALAQLNSLPGNRPILVTETATAEGPTTGKDKAKWIHAFVTYLSQTDDVIGFVWFQANKERDWRFNSTTQAQTAMNEALAGRA